MSKIIYINLDDTVEDSDWLHNLRKKREQKESLKLKINKGINEYNEDTVISNEENDPKYGYGGPVNTT